jgi:hypothetical protein
MFSSHYWNRIESCLTPLPVNSTPPQEVNFPSVSFGNLPIGDPAGLTAQVPAETSKTLGIPLLDELLPTTGNRFSGLGKFFKANFYNKFTLLLEAETTEVILDPFLRRKNQTRAVA